MITGTDLTMLTPPGAPVAEVVLRVCRTLWPQGVWQDADGEELHILTDTSDAAGSMEFFVFKNMQIAKSWDESGTTQTNENGFLHFLIEAPPAAAGQLTLVCDREDEFITALLGRLREELARSASPRPVLAEK